MAEITLSEPAGPYRCVLDTDVMTVQIRKAFVGITFVTEGGALLSVCMRDDGFEIHYYGHEDGFYFDAGWIECKSQHIGQVVRKIGDKPPDEVFLKAIKESND